MDAWVWAEVDRDKEGWRKRPTISCAANSLIVTPSVSLNNWKRSDQKTTSLRIKFQPFVLKETILQCLHTVIMVKLDKKNLKNQGLCTQAYERNQ